MIFETRGASGHRLVSQPTVAYYSEGATRDYFSANVAVLVTAAGIDGDMLEISGAFARELRFRAYSGSPLEKGPEVITVDDGAFPARVAD